MTKGLLFRVDTKVVIVVLTLGAEVFRVGIINNSCISNGVSFISLSRLHYIFQICAIIVIVILLVNLYGESSKYLQVEVAIVGYPDLLTKEKF